MALTLTAQIPDNHPAVRMRKYYADVYTSRSIVCFESNDLDSLLTICKELIVPAQVISLYSYVEYPYNYAPENVFENSLEGLASARSSLGSLLLCSKESPEPFNYYWTAKQYYLDFSRGVSGRYRYW